MNIRTILVPVDFSACSLFVTRQTAELAARLSARLVVLHVAELPAGVSRDTRVRPEGVEQSAHDYLSSDARERLAPFVAAARELGAAAEIHVEFGHVVPTILRVADAIATRQRPAARVHPVLTPRAPSTRPIRTFVLSNRNSLPSEVFAVPESRATIAAMRGLSSAASASRARSRADA